MKNFRRLLRLIIPYWPLMLFATIIGTLTVGSNIGLLATSAVLISSAALHPPILDLMTLIVGVRFFGISRAVFRYLERYITHDITFRILSKLRVWFYTKIEPLAPARLMGYKSGELLSRIVGDIETLKFFYLRVLAAPLVAFLVLAGVLIFIAWFYLKAALVLLFFYLVAGLVIPLAIKYFSQATGKQILELKSNLNVQLVDSIQGMTEITAYTGEKLQERKINHLSKEIVGLQEKVGHLNGLSSALTGLLMHLAMWSVLLLTIPLVTKGELKGIYLAMLALGALGSFEAVLPMPMVFQQLDESLEATARLFEITDTEPLVEDTGDKLTTTNNFQLQVAKLYFQYSKDSNFSLEGINFTLNQGEKKAIVGPSGSGKSTLINLLLRFWDYERGSITFGGKEIKDYSSEYLRSFLGVMTQETYLFNGTIMENILLARPEAKNGEVMDACQKAKIQEFIDTLPQGYDTYVGDQGFKLSGGQRKRIAMARVLLKNAPILILDEATVGLDAVTEKEVMEAILDLMQDKSVLVITHRLTGLDKMEEIIVLDEGRIRERGKHEMLIAQKGLYYKMWHSQQQIIGEKIN